MNSVTQNTQLLNIENANLHSYFSFLNAPFTSHMSSLDYATLIENASTHLRTVFKESFVSAIEKADLLFRHSPDRIHRYYVKQTRPRTIITIFGEITFRRTEYVCRHTGKPYCYIDRKLSLFPKQRYDCCVEARAKELYADHNSMIKVGKLLGEQIFASFSVDPNRKRHHLPRQTIYALLHRTGKIHIPPTAMKHTPDTLYIMADEKWIPVQKEEDKEKKHDKEMVKVAICFEGKEREKTKHGQYTNRYHLQNKYIYSACTSEKNNFWESFFDQLSYRYDLNQIRKIYVMGDGASWIQTGAKVLTMPGTQVKSVLDRYHASQAIGRMVSDKTFQEILRYYLYALKREEFDTVANIAKSYLSKESEIERYEENLNYIQKHWNAFQIMIKEVKIGCPMEQAISHIIASHFTSVPKAYGRKNIPLYLNSRVLSQNHEDVLVAHLIARDITQGKKEDVTLQESMDFSYFDNQIRNETYTVNIKNRSNHRTIYPF